ncbi:abc transporter substrate-binding protein : Urea/short-chain amide ABC transporter, periplasmic urea/short-chain amide-binding protein OS=Rhodopirellula sallentina SM41 GN=RSSM_05980 PE=4 SV=1: Pkinase: Peripla_BP_5 [Gemmataceae bacterium]|nr:abc transporter substrate-binding protein : Urea/short-chain amide ABC transporter, periplasmic urea/short-chain amide-binding protein OS=Rhodopirellula sallentina SM41 GN=RSSM_05980 PE=4 SV=1: Pkinase: Peripla_BP_5 [Gemmataceae bacterium]VTT96810.1 abc transporter substrate-binding protein : Urea/short-chain amide ABC transporter, periplasmic urea/short-chain amide-binding protein OS=Rhodopirellula sallentina SM41 GN=RSSM_05980 PE=4 SV=1: Pkinase: Peripla_BP_5 [Gemmataceae bacterium]
MSLSDPRECETTSEMPIDPAPSGTPYPFLSPPAGPDELGRLGDYRVLRVLGTGGMGVVFEAEEVALSRRVALKVLLPELAKDRDSRERFLREARAAAAVQSDHVVTIYNIAAGDVPYLAMQFLEGETVQARMDRQPPLTLREALEIARQTALGLAAAHDKGLVHRDVKPANLWLEQVRGAERGSRADVLLTPAPRGDGPASGTSTRAPAAPFRVKILDFGLARLASGETNLTSSGLVMGTPNYMSPEQAAGLDLDGRSDLFSLGSVLYAMLVGNLPFPGNTAMAVMLALATKTPPRVDRANPGIPKAVADFVAALLKKKRDRRPASARAAAAALEELIAGVRDDVPLRPCSAGHTTGNYFLGDTVARLPAAPAPESSGPIPVAPTSRTVRRRRWASRSAWAAIGLVVVAAAAVGVRAVFAPDPPPAPPDPILIGVLHSQTGTMAVQEGPLIDATVFAIDELNAAGGVLGRPLRAVVVDGKSDPTEFQRAAERLLAEHRVSVIFGCMTSPSRKTVMGAVERDNGLLFYPVSFEGLEQSPRIVYTGAVPNQKHLPAIEYLVKTLGKKRLFVVGSDIVSPRCTTEVVRDYLRDVLRDGEIVDARFVPFGTSDFAAVGDAIAAARPDAVLNILNGASNFSFYRELRRRGVTAAATPTLSITLTEHDLIGFDPKLVAGDYLAANYFQEIDRAENRAFLAKVKARFGDQRVVTDNMTAAYSGVHIWARAAAKAGSPDPVEVLKAVGGVEFDGPSARVRIDPENHYGWRPWQLGRIRADGTVQIVAQAPAAVRADPFPATRTRREWDHLLMTLYLDWGGRWQAPGPEQK